MVQSAHGMASRATRYIIMLWLLLCRLRWRLGKKEKIDTMHRAHLTQWIICRKHWTLRIQIAQQFTGESWFFFTRHFYCVCFFSLLFFCCWSLSFDANTNRALQFEIWIRDSFCTDSTFPAEVILDLLHRLWSGDKEQKDPVDLGDKHWRKMNGLNEFRHKIWKKKKIRLKREKKINTACN